MIMATRQLPQLRIKLYLLQIKTNFEPQNNKIKQKHCNFAPGIYK